MIVHDTHPTPAPPPLRLDEAGWRALYAALLEIADAQGTHARRATRVLFEAGEIALGELDDWANADTAWAAALEHSPHFGPALLARLDLAITRDAPSAAAGVFEAVLRAPEGALERRETSAILETCLLAWVFRWRDLGRAASAAEALRRVGDAERLIAPLEALYETPDAQRARLESAVARASTTEGAALGAALGTLLFDVLDARDAAFAALGACADESVDAAWLLCEASAEVSDFRALVAALERLSRCVARGLAPSVLHVCGELCEHRLLDPMRADVFYERSRGGSMHVAVSIRRVVQALAGAATSTLPGASGAGLAVRRFAEEAAALDEHALGRVFAHRAIAHALRAGDASTAERLARAALARQPDDEHAWTTLVRSAWQARRWAVFDELWRARPVREDDPHAAAVERLVRGAVAEHALFDLKGAAEALTAQGGVHQARSERDLTALRALQRVLAGGAPSERVRAWQHEADATDSPDRRLDLFLKIARSLLRHTHEHEKALTYLLWVLDGGESPTAARLAEVVGRARGSERLLHDTLARARTEDAVSPPGRPAQSALEVEVDLDGPPTDPDWSGEVTPYPLDPEPGVGSDAAEADPYARLLSGFSSLSSAALHTPVPAPSAALVSLASVPAVTLEPPPAQARSLFAERPAGLSEEVERPTAAEPARAVIAAKLKRARAQGGDAPGGSPWLTLERAALGPLVARVDAAARASADADERADALAALARGYEAEALDTLATRAWAEVLAWRARDLDAERRLEALLRAQLEAPEEDAARTHHGRLLVEVLLRRAERAASPLEKCLALLDLSSVFRGPMRAPLEAAEALRAVLARGLRATDDTPAGRRLRAEREAVVAALQAGHHLQALTRLLAWPERTAEQVPGEVALQIGALWMGPQGAPEVALPWLRRAAQALDAWMPRAELATCLARVGSGAEATALALALPPTLAEAGAARLRVADALEARGAHPDETRALYVAAFDAGCTARPLLERLERGALVAKDWALLARVTTAQLEAAEGRARALETDPTEAAAIERAALVDEQRDLAVRLGHLYAKRLAMADRAAEAFLRAYRLDPTDHGLLRVLEGLLARHAAPVLQIELYGLYLDHGRPGAREAYARTLTLAGLLEQAGRAGDAIDRLRALPPTPEVEATIERLLPLAGRWAEVAAALRERLRAPDADHEALLRRLASVLETGLRDLTGATDALRELLFVRPDDLSVVKGLCRLLEGQRRWEALVEMSERELALTPDARPQAWILFRIGSLYETRLDRPEAAARCYRRAVGLDPRCFPALHGLREMAVAASQWPAVLDALAREAELWDEPRERAAIYARMAEVLERHLNDRPRAMAEHRRAVATYPACLPSLQALADDAIARRAWDEAAPWLQVLTAQNLDRWSRAQRAHVLIQRGQVALHLSRRLEAAECMRLALDLAPEDPQALEVLVALGPLIEGPELDELLARVARVEQAAADDARRAECAVWRGRAYARALAWGKADVAFEAARRLQPTSIEALRPWIDHLIETRRHAQAAEALRAFADALAAQGRSVTHGELDAIAHALRWAATLWCDQLGEPERGLDALQRWLEVCPESTDAQLERALCLRLLGRGREARDALLMLLVRPESERLTPSVRARWHHALGRVLADTLQDAAGALVHFDAALALDPRCASAALAWLRTTAAGGGPDAADRIDAWLREHPQALEPPAAPDPAYGLLCVFVAKRRRARGDREGARAALLPLTTREGPTTRDAHLALLDFAEADGRVDDALEVVAALLARDVGDLDALRRLAELAARSGRDDRLLTTLDTLALYETLRPAESARLGALRQRQARAYERTPRPVPEGLLVDQLNHPAFESPLIAALGALEPGLAKVFGEATPPAGRRVERPPPEWRWCAALTGVKGATLVHADAQEAPIAVYAGNAPLVALGPRFFAPGVGAAHRRFWLGRALWALRTGTARLHGLEAERAVEVMGVVEALFTPSAAESLQARAVFDALPQRVADALGPELERRRQGTLPALYTGESALAGVVRSGDRFGLWASGALRAALECAAGLTPDAAPDLAWVVRVSPRMQDLVRWGISEHCATLRGVTGLGP